MWKVVAIVLAVALAQGSAQQTNIDFDNDLEGWINHRGHWYWSNRENLEWNVPAGGDGFATFTNAQDGGELFLPSVDISGGIDYEITAYLGTEHISGTTFQIQRRTLDGEYVDNIAEYTSESVPWDFTWKKFTGRVEPYSSAPSSLGMFCHINQPNTVGENLWGCAVDSIVVTSIGSTTTEEPTTTTEEPTTTTEEPTTTTEEPTTTTEEPTTTTEEPTTTTEEPTTTTEEPTTTTEEPTTTTEEPTTTTEEPTTTTEEPTTTTEEPTTTTEEPTTTTEEPTTTTEEPTTIDSGNGLIDWTFENGTAGWTLGRSNGASWRRETTFDGVVNPSLQVFPEDVHSGTVLAMSPRLTVDEGEEIKLTVEFFIKATREYPAYLKIRRRLSYTVFDEHPALNLDSYGDQINTDWITVSGTFTLNVVAGEEFNIVIEGGLGINNQENSIAVRRVTIEGATEIPYQEQDIFDFSDGLVGWQAGGMDGGKWDVFEHIYLNPNLNIPAPSSGEVLAVDRFDIHSGVVTIESPPLSISALTAKTMNIRFWIRGSTEYPVHFRIGLKTIDGVYDPLPFLNLAEYGNSNPSDYTELQQNVQIPADPREDFFQLVLEVDLGADLDNLIAIDKITINTADWPLF